MGSDVDLIYDRLVAEEKLKAGTKYERLAAIAFRELTGQATVHDLRLRGSSGVRHQIDAVVGEDHKRILIECKDYGSKIGLSIIRDFSAVVADIEPAEAFVVTTVGFTQDAVKFAESKGIRLALLRPPDDQDWSGVVRKVVLDVTVTGQTGPPNVTWEVHPDDRDKIDGDSAAWGLAQTADMKLANEAGEERPFLPIIDEQLAEDYGTVPLGGEAAIGRANVFDEPTWLIVPGKTALRVRAWKWEVGVVSDTFQRVIDGAIAGLAVQLVLRTTDGTIRKMFTNKQIAAWTFDGHDLVPRDQ